MRKMVNLLFAIGLFIFISGYLSAGVVFGNPNHSIQKEYSPGASLKGFLNMSIQGEMSNSTIKTNFGNSTNLIKLLELNEFEKDIDYTCSPNDCQAGYSEIPDTSETEKILTLGDGEEKIVGFKLSGTINQIDSITFDVSSLEGPSCVNQIDIDILDDGAVDFINSKSSNDICEEGKNYGCFNITKQTSSFILSSANPMYCQTMTIPISPGIYAGAWINNTGTTNATLKMILFEKDGSIRSECIISGSGNLPNITNIGGEYQCPIEYVAREEGDYYLCISTNGGQYKIRGSSANKCGFPGSPSPDSKSVASYQISSISKKFDAFGTFKADLTANQQDSEQIYEYLRNFYGQEIQCPDKGCIIPLKIKSNVDEQSITLNSLSVEYTSDIGGTVEDKFFDVQKAPAEISSEFLVLNLDEAEFLTPAFFGKQNLSITLNGRGIFSEKISIEKIPQISNVNPKIIPAAYPTEIRADIESFDSNTTIIGYEWDFGDGGFETTTEETVTHTYDATGDYTLTLTISDSDEHTSSKTFEITVEKPIDAINHLFEKNLYNLESIRTQMELFDQFQKDSIESILNLGDIDIKISQLQQQNSTATSDEDYIAILNELTTLNVPDTVYESKTGDSLFFIPDESNIDLDALAEITGEEFDAENEQAYVDAVISWYLNNVKSTSDFREFSAAYDNNSQAIVNIFEIDVKNNGKSPATLLIPKIEGLKFAENYGEKENEGYFYIAISGEQAIQFSTTESVEVSEIGAFIAPKISELSVRKRSIAPINPDELSRQTIMVLLFILLGFLGVVAYIGMQYWYKKRYENHLFKNKNDLYNMTSYIQNSKKQGIDGSEIQKRLKKSGWTSEQVTYVMKKYFKK